MYVGNSTCPCSVMAYAPSLGLPWGWESCYIAVLNLKRFKVFYIAMLLFMHYWESCCVGGCNAQSPEFVPF